MDRETPFYELKNFKAKEENHEVNTLEKGKEKFNRKKYMKEYINGYMRKYYYDDLDRSKNNNKYYYYYYKYGLTKEQIENKTKEELKQLILLNNRG